MTHFKGSSKTHSLMQGIGQKVAYAAEVAGNITGMAIAKEAYTLFDTMSPYLPMIIP